MFAQFLLDFSQQKVRFAQVLAFSKVAKTEGEVFVALWAYQGDFEPSRATISPQSPCSLIPAGFGLLMGKFCQIFTELPARDMPIFSFLDDNLSK